MSNSGNVSLSVEYAEGEPIGIEYWHNVFGLMKLDVDGDTATLDPEWDRLKDGSLKDGFTRGITTGDVLRSVQNLPFIESLEVGESE